MSRLFNRIYANTATTGTGTLTMGSAASNAYLSFADASVPDGSKVSYCIEEGTDFELGTGTYNTSGTTLSRDNVTISKIGGTVGTTKMTLANAAKVRVVALEKDFEDRGDLGFGGRLTLTSNTPVTTADVTSAANVYVAPTEGGRAWLYTGTIWTPVTFTQLTISLASGYTSGKGYDVFGYLNNGTMAVETLVWTNDTTRATALAYQDGILVKSGDATRRYLGSFYTTSSTTTEDSRVKRFVWNYYNRRDRELLKLEATATWNYSTAAYRQANNSAANQVEIFVGVVEDAVIVGSIARCVNSTSTFRAGVTGIGVNTIASVNPLALGVFICNNAASGIGGVSLPTTIIQTPTSIGRHYYAWLEYGAGADTQTWSGSSYFGLFGNWRA